jgi:DNA anti-recombination protein RmuC
MTGEEMERAIEFLLSHHARVSSDIQELKESQKLTAANIAALGEQAAADRLESREMFARLTGEMHQTFNSVTAEMHQMLDSMAGEMHRMFNSMTEETRQTIIRLSVKTHQMFDSMSGEMRDGFNKLILANEVTRDLASQVARLAIATSQRVTVLEDRSK